MNDLEYEIGIYQSRTACLGLGISLTEALTVMGLYKVLSFFKICLNMPQSHCADLAFRLAPTLKSALVVVQSA